VAGFAIEEIKEFDGQAQVRIEIVADAGVDERRGRGAHAVVFRKRARAEVAKAQFAEGTSGAFVVERDARSEDSGDRFGNVAAGQSGVIIRHGLAEARL